MPREVRPVTWRLLSVSRYLYLKFLHACTFCLGILKSYKKKLFNIQKISVLIYTSCHYLITNNSTYKNTFYCTLFTCSTRRLPQPFVFILYRLLESIKLLWHSQFNVRYWFVLHYFPWRAIYVIRIANTIIEGLEWVAALWLLAWGCSESALQDSFDFLPHAYTVNNTHLQAKLFKKIHTSTRLLQSFPASCDVCRGLNRIILYV